MLKEVVSKELTAPANIISLSRIPLAIAAVLFFDNKILFFSLLLLSGITDMLDGAIARKQGRTRYGGMIDAFADKTFFVILFIYLLATSRIEWWQLIMLLLRDILVILLSVFSWLHPKRDKIMKSSDARWSGKITTGCQFITLLLIVSGFGGYSLGLYVTAAVGLWASIEYLLRVMKNIEEK